MATFLTGAKNGDNVGYTQSLPAGMQDVFGVTVQEVEPIFADNVATVRISVNGHEWESKDSDWCDLLEGTAHMIGTYADTYKKGMRRDIRKQLWKRNGILYRNRAGTGCIWSAAS